MNRCAARFVYFVTKKFFLRLFQTIFFRLDCKIILFLFRFKLHLYPLQTLWIRFFSSGQHNIFPYSVPVVSSSYVCSTNNGNLSSCSSCDSLRIQYSPRWIIDPLFPRQIPLFQYLSSITKDDDIARNGLVEGHLLEDNVATLPLIGIVALEWSNWLPALSFIHLTQLWIWFLDSRWRVICVRLFPDCSFIDGFNTSLPAVDILFLSRVSLSRFSIRLSSAPFSLLVTTASNILRGCWRYIRYITWRKSCWRVPHSQVGGETTGLFKLYSLSRISSFKPPSLSSLPHPPAGNVGRVVDDKTGGDINADASVLHNASKYLLSSDLFPFTSPDTLFKVNLSSLIRDGRFEDCTLQSCFDCGIIRITLSLFFQVGTGNYFGITIVFLCGFRVCYCASWCYQLGVRGEVVATGIALGSNKGVNVARIVESSIDEVDGASTDVVMTDVRDSDLTLGDRVGSLVGGSDGDLVLADVGARVNSDLTLGEQVDSLVGDNDRASLKEGQSFEELLSERAQLRSLALENTLNVLLEKNLESELTATVDPAATIEVKSKKNDEAEIPTHLWLRWLNDGSSNFFSKDE